MAITNEQIIFNAQMQLLEAGKIKPTGRMIEVETADGKMTLPEPEEIHTFARWKALGYKVRKGEHAVARLTIWKHAEKKDQDDERAQAAENDGFCFHKVSCFFAASQVDPA